jgi:DNA sulfur modification protein DndC
VQTYAPQVTLRFIRGVTRIGEDDQTAPDHSQETAMSTRLTTTSAFAESGIKQVVEQTVESIKDLFLQDSIPWVIGYSGGKDSTACLQLIWMALQRIPESQRPHKPVYVITNDTLVENPVVVSWVGKSHEQLAEAAQEQGLNVEPKRLTPKVSETFWVTLLGKGYPAPNRRFRWCTDRMKIWPSTAFIRQVVSRHGESIIVIGARKAESSARAARIAKFDAKALRDGLTPHPDIPSSLVFKPIVDWTDDDVWMFLMQYPNPWGFDNKNLMSLYAGAAEDGECPVVIDTSTASCGNSRFGCWTCTVVDKDKSMAAMIRNDYEKEWMLPLLQFRDRIDAMTADTDNRDFRRMNGEVQFFNGQQVYGPFKPEVRAELLRELLTIQTAIRQTGPEDVRDIELITMPELHEIRRVWLLEKNEWHDALPALYEDAAGEPFPAERFDESFPFGADELGLLSGVARNDLQYELLRDLLVTEQGYRSMARRHGLFEGIDKVFARSGYHDEQEAVERARLLAEARAEAQPPTDDEEPEPTS